MNTRLLTQRGFTLIELLVVIAIIAILASVVLASLNTARERGEDAAIQSSLNNARAQAELYYDASSPRSYNDVCTATSGDDPAGIADFVTAATETGGGADAANCNDDADGWAADKELNTGTYYCVDSTGVSVDDNANALTSGDTTCN